MLVAVVAAAVEPPYPQPAHEVRLDSYIQAHRIFKALCDCDADDGH